MTDQKKRKLFLVILAIGIVTSWFLPYTNIAIPYLGTFVPGVMGFLFAHYALLYKSLQKFSLALFFLICLIAVFALSGVV